MKTTSRNGKSAFTLIELLAVITIIVILAGLVVGSMGFVKERQAKEKAKVQIALLSKALEEYKLDNGAYPATDNIATVRAPKGTDTSKESLYQTLFYEGYEYGDQATPPTTWTKMVNGVDFPKSTKIYLGALDPTSRKQGWVVAAKTVPRTSAVIDPWGNEYCYRSATNASGAENSATQSPGFELWSMGKDGKSDSNPKHKDCLDDIKNL